MPFYKENYFLSLLIYLASLMAFVVLLGALLVRRSKGFRVPVFLLLATLFLTSYPLDTLVDRGNTEGVVLMVLACGLIAYRGGYTLLSAVLIGLAASPANRRPALFPGPLSPRPPVQGAGCPGLRPWSSARTWSRCSACINRSQSS